MRFISSLSGGAASAVATDRAIRRYGRNKVTIWMANTRWEDEDLWRFVDDCMARWGGKLHLFTEGRTPLEVAENRNIIPNQKIAPCTFVLKIEPFTNWLWRVPKNVTVLLGLGWHEMHRIEKRMNWHKNNAGKWGPPNGYQRKIPGVYEDYPLLWKPYDFDPFQTIKSWGIKAPRLYEMGFPHNNCGGRCFRQGISEWLRLRVHLPERFEQVRDWEAAQQAKGGALAKYAICRDQSGGSVTPLSLRAIERRELPTGDIVQEDMFSCFCSY